MTLYAATGSLLAHAKAVTPWCEAAGTTQPCRKAQNKPRGAFNDRQRQAVGEPGWSGMANECELPINVLISKGPKTLRGPGQNGTPSDIPLHHGNTRTKARQANRQSLTHSQRQSGGTWKPRMFPGKGKRTARDADERAGMGGWKKRKPACNGPDRG